MFSKEQEKKTTNKSASKINIFDFSDYSDFLKVQIKTNSLAQGRNNLKYWAGKLGYQSASSLSMVLKKQRLPSLKIILSFSESVKLNKNETKYFQLLVGLERNKQKGNDVDNILSEIKEISRSDEFQDISYDHFSMISDWHCLVIKRLVSKKGFINDVDWIYNTLRKKVSKSKITKSINTLLNLGVLAKDDQGNLIDTQKQSKIGGQLPSSAIKNHQRGMIKRSLDALDEQNVDNRIFQALTLNIEKKENLEEAFGDIQEFIHRFNKKYSKDKTGGSTYQLNVQLFEHSNSTKGTD